APHGNAMLARGHRSGARVATYRPSRKGNCMTRFAPITSALAAACLLAACASAPPAPPPEPPAPPPASFDHTLSGDALFAFGKSSIDNLSPAGRAELDALAERVLAAPAIDMVHVIGHSDRIGNDRANVALSNRRAQAVRD